MNDSIASWNRELEQQGVDYVPDPLLLRVADLFILGKAGCANGLDADAAWQFISRNIPALYGFFHVLMTREKLPLIDYGTTFPLTSFYDERFASVRVLFHPAIYGELLSSAQEALREIDFSLVSNETARSLAGTLRSVGYDWDPDPDDTILQGPQRTVASFYLGGRVFNDYAKFGGADHLTQPDRVKLFLELMTPPEEFSNLVTRNEEALFRELSRAVTADPKLRQRDLSLPPSVLAYLLEKSRAGKAPQPARALVDEALAQRSEPAWCDYREKYQTMRSLWRAGKQDEALRDDLSDVVAELSRRFGPRTAGKSPSVWSREVGGKANAAQGAPARRGRDSFSNKVRDWVSETLYFRGHRKVLLDMALAEQHFRDMSAALWETWIRG